LPVIVIKEDSRAIVAALSDVMRITGGYDTCDSWHVVNDTAEIRAGQL